MLKTFANVASAFKLSDIRTGLFGIPGLLKPNDFLGMAEDCKTRVKDLVQQISACPEDASVIQIMDDVSNELCRVYDAAECCRNVHSDKQWRQAAFAVCGDLGEYVAAVNHHQGMYSKLSRTMEALRSQLQAPPHSSQLPLGFTSASALVGAKLLLDMDKAGVGLPELQQARMVELMSDSNHFAAKFMQSLSDVRETGSLNLSGDAVTALAIEGIAGMSRSGSLPLDCGTVSDVLNKCSSENIRRQVYLASSTTPASNLELLQGVISIRQEMAALVGYDSFAAMKMDSNSLAGVPAAASEFLGQIGDAIRPQAEAEVQVLRGLKARLTGEPLSATRVEPWDLEYCLHRARRDLLDQDGSEMLEYLNLRSVLEGVCELLERTFSLKLTFQPAPPSEAWAPGVLKAEAHHKSLGKMGVIYLDIEPRPGKFQGAVTFPILCGKRLASGEYQTPIMALLVDVSGTMNDGGSLRPSELRTLLHELGHCMHNLISRTHFQHLWGSRCVQDMVEVPSTFFELFMRDSRSLAVLARHRHTRAPLPPHLSNRLRQLLDMFSALETQSQIHISLVDLTFFGPSPPTSTKGIWTSIAERTLIVPPPPGVCPEARIGHFTIYGAAYYSYLFARCLSAAFWDQYMAADPFDSEAGNSICRLLLEPGGEIEPYHLVKTALGSEALQAIGGGWAPQPEAYLRLRSHA